MLTSSASRMRLRMRPARSASRLGCPRRARPAPSAAGPGGSPAGADGPRSTPLTAGANALIDLAERRREDVDAAHDQHVVGAADAADARRRPPAGAAPGPQLDMVAAAEAEKRRGLAVEMGVDQLALGAVGERRAAAPLSGSISSKWTRPRPLKCMPCCSSHSPQSETAMSPIPIASVTCAPQARSSLRAHRRLAAARLAGDHDPLDAGRGGVEAALARPFGEVERVGGRQRHRLRLEQPDGAHQPVGVAAADRDDGRRRAR